MGLDLNGTTITYSASQVSIKDSGNNTIFTFDTAGRMVTGTSVPCFRAHNTTPGWVGLSADSWNTFLWNSTPTNQGSHFASSVFTAPVTGAYLFAASTYCYGQVLGHYVHPSFGVNGGLGNRRPGAQVEYRMRGQYCTAGYSFDCQICDIYYLTAADYVTFYGYHGGNTVAWYPQYSHFSGCFLG